MKDKINIFWFRRDLRLDDNVGLYQALQDDVPVLPIFIFDTEILENLPKNDAIILYIHMSALFFVAKISKTLMQPSHPIHTCISPIFGCKKSPKK